MKKAALIAFLILIYPPWAFAQPSIYFDNTSHDFGEVKEGELLEYTFKYMNRGTDALIINSVKTS